MNVLRNWSHQGRHRAPVVRPVPPTVIINAGIESVLRHLWDGRTESDAWDLASIDAADMRAAQKASVQ